MVTCKDGFSPSTFQINVDVKMSANQKLHTGWMNALCFLGGGKYIVYVSKISFTIK